MASIYLLRHIKTYNNLKEVISGRSDALTIPNQTIQIPSDSESFDMVYSSPSIRCKNTIELIPPEMIKGNIIYTTILLERDVGVLEKMSKREALEQYPYLFNNKKIDVNALIPGGETINDMIKRIKPLIDFIKQNTSPTKILICSHNQTLKVIYALIKNFTITNQYWQQFDLNQGIVMRIV